MRRVVGVALVAVLLAITSPAAATEGRDVESGRDHFSTNCAMCHGADASGMMGEGMDGRMWWGPLVGLLLLAVIVAVVVVAVRRWNRSPASSDTGRDILDRRYAEGRISRDDYMQARADLAEASADPPRVPGTNAGSSGRDAEDGSL